MPPPTTATLFPYTTLFRSRRRAESGGRARGNMSGRQRPTIFDVAVHSGVSKSTVSNVIRGAPNVAEETRGRVLAAVAELGYRPNAVARHLVQQRTSTIGVVV